MLRLLAKAAPVLHLTRVTTAFAAVSNIWFVILWSRAKAGQGETPPAALLNLPEWALLVGGAVVGVGLYAYAVALNDILDVRRDRALHPERPLASGRLSVETAVALVACTLLISVVGAAALGVPAVLMAALTAGAALLFNVGARFIPAVGLVALGLIYAAHMLIPNPDLAFMWPVWVVMTHALIVGAVTHKLGGRRPLVSRRAVVLAVTGWLFWSVVLLWLGRMHAGEWWPSWVPARSALWIAILAIAFVAFAMWKRKTSTNARRASERLSRYGSLWLALYNTAWLAGAGEQREAIILAVLAVIGLVGMTALRELYGVIEQPLGYRR